MLVYLCSCAQLNMQLGNIKGSLDQMKLAYACMFLTRPTSIQFLDLNVIKYKTN